MTTKKRLSGPPPNIFSRLDLRNRFDVSEFLSLSQLQVGFLRKRWITVTESKKKQPGQFQSVWQRAQAAAHVWLTQNRHGEGPTYQTCPTPYIPPHYPPLLLLHLLSGHSFTSTPPPRLPFPSTACQSSRAQRRPTRRSTRHEEENQIINEWRRWGTVVEERRALKQSFKVTVT